jgi:hypothetical protein
MKAISFQALSKSFRAITGKYGNIVIQHGHRVSRGTVIHQACLGYFMERYSLPNHQEDLHGPQ